MTTEEGYNFSQSLQSLLKYWRRKSTSVSVVGTHYTEFIIKGDMHHYLHKCVKCNDLWSSANYIELISVCMFIWSKKYFKDQCPWVRLQRSKLLNSSRAHHARNRWWLLLDLVCSRQGDWCHKAETFLQQFI